MRIKDIVAAAVLLVLIGAAVRQRMEWFAIVCTIGFVSIVFQSPVRRALEIGLTLLQSTRQAKVGTVAFDIRQDEEGVSVVANEPNGLDRVLLGRLKSEHVGLLLQVAHAGRLQIADGVRNSLRDLRNRGLFEHDRLSLRESSEVWLSPTGLALAQRLSPSGSFSGATDRGKTD